MDLGMSRSACHAANGHLFARAVDHQRGNGHAGGEMRRRGGGAKRITAELLNERAII